ncbi:MAG: hypothetical protein EOO39_36100 [Cytophagaceae bacterium]|nr:MAG: hypothetical protein EOO39_36100 [Cytophagaceae bacterium]
MANQSGYQPGDVVTLLEGGTSPMTVKSVKNDGMTVVCVANNDTDAKEEEFDATKLTKLKEA